MKGRRLLGILVFALLQLMTAQSQEKTVVGTVTDERGVPLPGVNILVENTTNGTQTDFDGKYSIAANEGQTLVFTYIGLKEVRRLIGSENVINIQMEEDAQALEEVVVTAQGIRKEKRALGYSITEVGSEQVSQRPEADLGRILNGKVAGVSITGTGGLAGSGTNITIRDKSSITQNNQPLFVVDGVPINTDTNTQTNFVNGGAVTPNRFLDLDPNNIESLSVLKGLSATVLYGEQGSNGVILITTKNGRTGDINKKFEVTLVQSNFISKISNLPDFQNIYGQGDDGNYNNNYVGNWGPRFDGSLVASNYDKPHIIDVFPEYEGLQVPYLPVKDNVKDFFRTGFSTNTSVNLSSSGVDKSINLSFGHTNEEGYLPGNKINRTNFGLGGNAKLSNKLSFASTFNFVTNNFQTPPVSAANGAGAISAFTRTLYIPRNFDLNNLPFQDPITGRSIYYRTDIENPRWVVANSRFSQNVRRFFSSTSLVYDISDKLKLTYRLGLDTYTDKQEFYVNRGGVATTTYQLGYLRQTAGTNTIWDHSLIMNYNDQLSNKIGVDALLGFNMRSDQYEQIGISNIDQVVFDFINTKNYRTQTNNDPFQATLQTSSTKNVLGVYGQVQFNYDTFLYLTLSARNDWASTVEIDNRSLFYPSANLSLIPTAAFPSIQSDFLNYLKVRVSYGTSAKFPAPYLTRPNLVLSTQQFIDANGNNIDVNSSNSLFANPNLKPELLKEYEIGLESKLLRNRINIDISVYNRIAEDQILRQTLDDATGYRSTFINAGEIETKGLEVGLSLTPFKNESFEWNLNGNFTAYETTVKSLPTDRLLIAGFSSPGNYAIEGEPLGAIVGNFALRDANGNFLIDQADGTVITNDDAGISDKVVGDPNPDWKLNGITSIRYKGLTLAGQVEYTHGGDILSLTTYNLLRRGVTTATLDRDGAIIIPGSYANPSTGEPILDSNGNLIPNNIAIPVSNLYFLNVNETSAERIYDGSHLRIRELSLTYEIPRKLLEKTPFGSLSASLVGQNIWVKAFNFPDAINFDPETISTGVGNGNGLDFQTAPTSKKFGLTLKATF